MVKVTESGYHALSATEVGETKNALGLCKEGGGGGGCVAC